MFALRTDGSLAAVHSLFAAFNAEQARPSARSELLLHEICYCLGQMLHSEEHRLAIQHFLRDITLQGVAQHSPLVIHEATEALGNISSHLSR